MYNTLFPMYKRLRNQIQKHIAENYTNEPEQKLIISTKWDIEYTKSAFFLRNVLKFELVAASVTL